MTSAGDSGATPAASPSPADTPPVVAPGPTDTPPVVAPGPTDTPPVVRSGPATARGAPGFLEMLAPSLAAAILYLVGAILLTRSVWAAAGTHWIGSCCDPEQTIWFLRWIPYALGHATDPLVTYQLNSPDGVNLMWNSSVPLLGLVMSPVTLVGGPILAYNVAMVATIALDAWCGRLAVGRYTGGTVGPFVAGAVYGFSPFVVPHAALHLNLAVAWAPPLFLVVLDELLVRRRRSPWLLGLALGVISVFELLTAEELLATSVVAAGVFVALLAACRPAEIRAGLARLLPALAAAAVSFLVIAAWPLAVQFLGPQRLTGSISSPDTYTTDLLNLILPTRYQLVSPAAATQISDHFSGLFHEANAYLGLPLLLLVTVVAARRWEDLRIRVAVLVAAVLFVLSLGPHLHIGGQSTGWPMPWLPFASLPLLENVVPGRFAVFMWLAIAVIVGLIVDDALGLPLRRAAAPLAALAIALATILPAPASASTTATPRFFERWDAEGIAADATVLVAPFFRDGGGADPMVWAAVAGDEVRMPEAYAYVPLADGTPNYGPAPTELSRAMEAIQDTGQSIVVAGPVRAQVALDLRAKAITDVIVGPMANRSQMVAFFSDLFGRAPEEIDGVELWRRVDRSGVVPKP